MAARKGRVGLGTQSLAGHNAIESVIQSSHFSKETGLCSLENSSVCDLIKQPPSDARNTNLIGGLLLTFLYLPSTFDEHWIYRI